MNNEKIAILLLTYNPDWLKLKRTIYSIICQKGVSFSLVISDDGSNNDCFAMAEKYLKENNFHRYKFIKNEQNVGTVKNILTGLSEIHEEYVKLISPGDFFFDENTLRNTVDFLTGNQCSACFGDVYTYNSKCIISKLNNPRDLTPYITENLKKQRYNFFRKADFIVGAALVYNTNRLNYWLKNLSSLIKYTEDTTTIAEMLAHNEIVKYMPIKDTGFVWYEIGTGISTNGDNAWVKIINSEIKTVFRILYEQHCISKIDLEINYSERKLKRVFLKLFLIPYTIFTHKLRRNFYIVNNSLIQNKIKKILKVR